ncbi:hypothetical protein F5882DRAFT_111032 [Hyaloscypha sp. PMI_1271]|nr:hypothetical protein F5882DRAFT_111032 [Hyaloscypha sp. PMI_1271]
MIKKDSPSFKVSAPEQSGRSVTCFIFTFGLHRPGYYQLALSYDRETGLTPGLLLAMTRKNHEIPRLLKGLRDRLMFCEQPLILAALVAELVIDSCATKIELLDGDLNALEEESGLHGYDNRARGDPLKMDFMRAIQILHFSNRTRGLDTIRLQYTKHSLIKIVMETKKIATQEHDQLREIGRIKNHVFISDGRRMVEELADTLKQYSKNQLLRAKYQDKRVQTQLAVVSRLMAQKDTKVNIEMARVNIDLANDTKILARASKEDSAVMRTIAVETKRDSSSMKTVAVLGMLFLPPTLLASLFQGPMMSWDAKGRPVTTVRFKYFWAIAVPLTFLVFFVWAVAMLLPWGKLLYKRRRAAAAKDTYSLEHIASHNLESG